jgi:uncharacterized protein
MKKQSIFNIWIDNILYNSFSDKAIQFEAKETDTIKYFLDNISLLKTEYPSLYSFFIKFNYIVEETFDEIRYLLFQNRKETLIDKNYHLTINPTLECNYKCWYCFVEEEKPKFEARRMNDQTIQKINRHIEYMINKKHIQSLMIDWFGGEPLMYFHEVVLPIATRALALCQEANIPFNSHVTTNAYYINDVMIDLFNTIKLNSFQIPIDGDEKKHNSVKNINDVGHYKQIIKSINSICERVENVTVIMRLNFDLQTLKNISPIIDDIKTENRQKIWVDFQRIWQIPTNVNENGDNELLIKAKKTFEEAGFNTNYFAYTPRYYRCCFTDRYYYKSINYDGKVFQCNARDYDESLIVGTLNDDGSMSLNEDLLSQMFDDTCFNNEKCLKCKKLPLCYGPCIQHCYETKTGKAQFFCRHDVSEISLKSYVYDKIEKQNKYLKQHNL